MYPSTWGGTCDAEYEKVISLDPKNECFYHSFNAFLWLYLQTNEECYNIEMENDKEKILSFYFSYIKLNN
jgi:hypothetical protein